MQKLRTIWVKLKTIIKIITLRPYLRYLEFHIADHCNLKCNACTHFSNISEPNIIDARFLEFRFTRLRELFGIIMTIRILGGEPLLHPDIIEILSSSRFNFPFSKIELVTNGLLLDKMPKEFFEACRRNKIAVYISKYPVIENKLKKINELLSSFKIKYYISPKIINFSANLNPKGDSDKDITFKNCRHKICTILREDNIYLCPIAAYIDKYNKYFNKNIPVPKGINIYSNSAKQILNYKKNSEETCRYCTNVANYVNWSCSNNPKETDWNGKI
ncbi:MAG: 4Fe-4S cluster-binding domain-containing protein [Elusimicrobia bacterium]|nr:4Fe-4S cluster-binding domain-containing protein [Elusimicrobiota bacterium]